jgi:hypothetical protein
MIKRALIIMLSILLAGCGTLFPKSSINVTIIDSGKQVLQTVLLDSTVSNIINSANITLRPLDRVTPSLQTVALDNMVITIVRVKEDFYVEDSILTFEHQTVKNESLPEGQSILIQAGTNGTLQTIYRILYEDGTEVSRSFVSSDVLVPSKPEIVMIGVQTPYSIQPITGIIAYLSSSNAWIMENNTGNRHPVVTTGDLDGRIFSISPDHQWLLFSRVDDKKKESEINQLWLVNLTQKDSIPIDTGIRNVVHYAEWIPGKIRTITYSTAELNSAPPFWNANNDLIQARFDEKGKIIEKKSIVDTNSGGQYGWWGSIYKWSNDGSKVAFSRPDAIGLVDTINGSLTPIIEFSPHQTDSVWAWVPSIQWSLDDEAIYTALPIDQNNLVSASPNLSALLINNHQMVSIVPNCGLFCSAYASPQNNIGNNEVAFLSAILPDQSKTSKYNLNLMDKDGSNQKRLYPGEGIQGLISQDLFWEPFSNANAGERLAFLAQGNLIFVETSSGSLSQITGDGSIEKIDWK